MSEEINRKEPKGIGGWLVLFQIYIIMAVAAGLESVLLMILPGEAMIAPPFVPYYIVLEAAVFLLALVCMVLFYCKRMAFRSVFMIYGIVLIGFNSVHAFYKTLYNNVGTGRYAILSEPFIHIVSIILASAIIVASIIALYKSQRVKNTFIKNHSKEREPWS
jgi:hypothetical protein